jgi:hypothetical protein
MNSDYNNSNIMPKYKLLQTLAKEDKDSEDDDDLKRTNSLISSEQQSDASSFMHMQA